MGRSASGLLRESRGGSPCGVGIGVGGLGLRAFVERIRRRFGRRPGGGGAHRLPETSPTGAVVLRARSSPGTVLFRPAALASLWAALLILAFGAPAHAGKYYSDPDCDTEHCSLSWSSISSLSPGDFSGPNNVHFMRLNNNHLTSLEADTFTGLSGVYDLNLRHNDLHSLEAGAFNGLPGLHHLHLDDNRLSSLPEGVFSGLPLLEELSLGYNRLSSLPEGVFSGLRRLKYVGLGHNRLSSLPEGIFRGLTNLQKLFLGHNELSTLPEGVFSGVHNLRNLGLGFNQLTGLPEGIFDGLSRLKLLYLVGNPLTCLPSLPSSLDVLYLTTDRRNEIDSHGLPLCDSAGAPVSNVAATGAPTIAGAAREGVALTADIGAIADADGLSGAAWGYEWLRVDGATESAIAGAASASYTPVAADVGKTLKVRVSFTDDAGNAETLTSTATSAVAANSAPAFAGATAGRSFGETVGGAVAAAADIGDAVSAADADGDALSYRLEGADAASFAVDSASGRLRTLAGVRYDREAKGSYAVTVAATDGRGGVARVAVTVAVTDAAEPPLAPAAPAVGASGAAALAVTWAAPDNAGRPAISGYQLQHRAVGGGDWTAPWKAQGMAAATLGGLGSGTSYEVRVRAVNADGAGAWSEAGRGAVLSNRPATGAPSIVDEAGVEVANVRPGARLGVDVSAIADADGMKGARFDYRWFRFFIDSTGRSFTDRTAIPDATSSTYEVSAKGRVGTWFAVRVSFTDDAGNEETLESDFVVQNHGTVASAPRALSSRLSGERLVLDWEAPSDGGGVRARYYEVRLSSKGGAFGPWTSAGYLGGESGDAPMPGTVTLKVKADRAPHAVEVRLVNLEGPGAAVRNSVVTGLPSIAGAARVGETLTVDTGALADADGIAEPAGYAYRWLRVAEEGEAEISGATGASYTPVASDTGAGLAVEVRFTDAGGVVEMVRSAATAAVEPLPGAAAQDGLSAELLGLPASHDGGTGFAFELRFSEDIPGLSYRTVGGALLDVTGARVTGARRLERSNRRWSVTVAPSGTGAVSIALAVRACGEAGAVCVEGRPLESAVSAVVPHASPAPDTSFRASFEAVPSEHDGETPFTAHLRLSEAPRSLSYRTVHDNLLDASGARVTGAHRLAQGGNLGWAVVVAPSGPGPVSLAVRATTSCAAPAAVCTADGRMLAAGTSVRVPGPAALSVADARAREGVDEHLVFAVTLDRARHAAVSVDYATSDGTASAGADYTAKSGTLTFAAGARSQTVTVPVLDDAHDEGSETLRLTLSNARGARIADGEAVGTIENTDEMPGAWLARFGRTVAGQVLEAVQDRMAAPPAPGAQMTVGGRYIDLGSRYDAAVSGSADVRGEAQERRADARTVSGPELLAGSSFALASEASGGGRVSVWGRGAVTRFDGRADGLDLDGEVATGLLGADYASGRWLTGFIASHSRSEGSYRGAGAGTVSSTLTGVHPWARYAVSERLSVWGAAGYGAGTLALTPEGPDGESRAAMKADLSLALAAAGARGVLLEPGGVAGGPVLALVSDAMFVRTESERTAGLVAASTEVTRVRLALDGAWRFALEGDTALTPSLEFGVRHDGGDAETGYGADIGGGLAISAPRRGLAFDVSARTLVTHEASGFRDRGLSAALTYDPRPSSERGLALSLRQTFGAASTGGAQALTGRETLAAGLGSGDSAGARRLEMTAGYGIAMFGGRFTGTPEFGLGLSDTGRDYRLGWRLGLGSNGAASFDLGLEATRRESAHSGSGAGAGDEAEHTAGFRIRAAW